MTIFEYVRTKNTWRVGRLPDGSGVLIWPCSEVIEVVFENHPDWAGEYADNEHYITQAEWAEYVAIFQKLQISWLPEGQDSADFVEKHFPKSRIAQGEDVEALFEAMLRRHKKYLDNRPKSDRIKNWLRGFLRLPKKTTSDES